MYPVRIPLTRFALVLASMPGFAGAALAAEAIGPDEPVAFFDEPADEALYRFEAEITIDDASLASGLVHSRTCHYNLDPIDRIEIAFAADRLHDLHVLSSSGIGSVNRADNVVQLRQVSRGANICLALRSRALEADGEGWVLRGGPLQRPLLDSLHPMAIRGTVLLNTPQLRFRAMEPAAQAGWKVSEGAGRVEYAGHFAGLLRTSMHFERTSPAPHAGATRLAALQNW